MSRSILCRIFTEKTNSNDYSKVKVKGMFNFVAPTQILFVTTAALDQLRLPAAPVYKPIS